MRRFLGAVLAGLGALLIVLAVGLPTFLTPLVSQLPTNLQQCKPGSLTDPSGCVPPVTVKAPAAAYLVIDYSGLHVDQGDLTSTSSVVPQPAITLKEQQANRIPDTAEIWAVYSVTTDAGGHVITKTSAMMALDRKTSAFVPWSKQYLDDGTGQKIEFKGNEYQFPFDSQKSNYAYFDENIKTTVTAVYKSTENVDGLDTYHYTINVPTTALNLPPDQIAALSHAFAKDSTDVQVTYSDTRDIWVDPTTGLVVKLQDKQYKALTKQSDGSSIQVLLDGTFSTNDATNKAAVDSASKNSMSIKVLKVYAPFAFGIIGLVLVIVGFLLLRSRGETAADAAGWDDSLPEPRHRLRPDEVPVEQNTQATPWPRQ